jgi:hypothetical protein
MHSSTIETGNGNNSIDISASGSSDVYAMFASSITTGAGVDIITLNGDMSGGAIDAGGGDDIITINGAMSGATITTGAGSDRVDISHWTAHSSLDSTIDLADGALSGDTNTLSVGFFDGTGGGTRTIICGNGNDDITIGDMYDGTLTITNFGDDGDDSLDLSALFNWGGWDWIDQSLDTYWEASNGVGLIIITGTDVANNGTIHV